MSLPSGYANRDTNSSSAKRSDRPGRVAHLLNVIHIRVVHFSMVNIIVVECFGLHVARVPLHFRHVHTNFGANRIIFTGPPEVHFFTPPRACKVDRRTR